MTRSLGLFAGLLVLVMAGCAGSVTESANDVTDTGATVAGLVFSPVDATISYWFEFGQTTAYGNETPHRSLVISDRDNHPVSEELAGLLSGTTYHYRTCAKTQLAVCAADQSFTTTGTAPLISAEPMLYPAFDPDVSDYVTRCGTGSVRVVVSAPSGTEVAIAGGFARTGRFTEDLPLTGGGSFEFSTTTDGQTDAFHVRCLPNDFPVWTFSRPGNPSASFYITAPRNVQAPSGVPAGRYIAISDDQGVPVWWKRAAGGTDASPASRLHRTQGTPKQSPDPGRFKTRLQHARDCRACR